MRRLCSFCLAILLLSVGLHVSPARSAPNAGQATESGITATAGASAAARAQNLLLSKGVTGENTGAAVAVDPNTGNVLVVWTQLGVPPATGIPDDVIWASLLIRKGSGKYKKPRTRRLSAEGGSQFALDVAWIEANKEFFAIWEQNNAAARGGFKRILGVPVNPRTGKPVGKVKTLVADDDSHASPVFVTGLAKQSGGSRKVVGSVGQILWRREPASSGDPTMEWASLSDTYETSNRATLPDSQIGFGSILGSLALSGGAARTRASPEGKASPPCVIMLHKDGSPPNVIATLTLWKNGKKVDTWPLGSGDKVTTIRPLKSSQAGQSLIGVHWSGFGTAFLSVRVPPCKEIRDAGSGDTPTVLNLASDLLGPQQVLALDPSQARRSHHRKDAPTDHLVTAEDDGRVYRSAFDDQWNLLDGPETLFSHGNKLTSLIAHNVASAKSSGKKPNALIVWTKSVGTGLDQEIWAHSFYVVPFE